MKPPLHTSVIALLAFSAPAFGQDLTTIKDDMDRTVEIPSNPQTVVITGGEELVAMLTSIGYVPAGMAWGYQSDVRQTMEGIGGDVGDLSEMAIVGETGDLDYEAIAALGPDLILDWCWQDGKLDKLPQIAPTVCFNPRFNTFGLDAAAGGERYAKQRVIAGLVGLEDALDEQIGTYEALLADVTARHADVLPDLEWTFLDTGDDFIPHMYDGVKYYTYSYHAVMQDLGLKESDAMNTATRTAFGYDHDDGYAQVSLELVPEYAADPIFVGRYDDAPLGDL